MLHARTARFDVTGTVALFRKTFRELNKGYANAPVGSLVLISLQQATVTLKKLPAACCLTEHVCLPLQVIPAGTMF